MGAISTYLLHTKHTKRSAIFSTTSLKHIPSDKQQGRHFRDIDINLRRLSLFDSYQNWNVSKNFSNNFHENYFGRFLFVASGEKEAEKFILTVNILYSITNVALLMLYLNSVTS